MKNRRLVLGVVYVALLVVVVYVLVSTKGFGLINKSGGKSSGWQAVFLTNGQVYFGHLKGESSQFATLTNIYYLQIEQQAALQPDRTGTTAPGSKLSLIKLGNELHGPTDEMQINRDSILFVEDLKTDSKVVAAINESLKNQNK